MGLEVLAYDPYVDAAAMEELGVQVVDLETVLGNSDYISLHSPLTDETSHLINAETLALMKPTAYLVNAARGGLIDEDALLAAVSERPDCGRRAGRVSGRTGGCGPPLSGGRTHLAHAPCRMVF